MGIIWRITMVLLSTLAALVIIVHTAEEDIELTYRRDLRPRDYDNGTPQYEQTWRVSEVDSEAQKPIQIQSDTWNNNSPEEPPKRRRPGRKRKRRPQQKNPVEDIVTQERYTHPERPSQSYIETNVQVTEAPKRRRKKLEYTPNVSQAENSERPLRGRRRKRPVLNARPESSESNVPQPEDIRLESILDPSDITDESSYTDTEGIRQLIEQNQSDDVDQREINTENTYTDFREQKTEDRVTQKLKQRFTHLSPTKEDISTSELSLELSDTPKHLKIDGSIINEKDSFKDKIKNKGFGVMKTLNNVENKGAMDPVTLKDILKRSNGTSLSEILQQHNLSLADLLSGRDSVISILNSRNSYGTSAPRVTESEEHRQFNRVLSDYKAINKPIVESNEESLFLNLETKYDPTKLALDNITITQTVKTDLREETNIEKNPTFNTTVESEFVPKLVTRRRLPGNRKRLRMRPMMNNTYNGQLIRDLMALSPRQQLQHSQRDSSKPAESNELALELNNANNNNRNRNIATLLRGDVTTVSNIIIGHFSDMSVPQVSNNEVKQEIMSTETPIQETSNATVEISDLPIKISEKHTVTYVVKHPVNSSTLRQQEFSNRLKRKKLKHKNTTTESPQDNILKKLFGSSDLVSSTKSTERTFTNLENKFISNHQHGYTTTASSKAINNVTKARLSSHSRTSSTTKSPNVSSSTEEFARIEIQEILNDIGTNARLTRILMERNMTLSELVALRERGSSNIHLADIFHNTSKEPNPPMPFLSKSQIEPISKETYPLRALLDVNIHENNGKVATLEPRPNNVNIPVVMDFGNNVNENADNVGMVLSFNNFTKYGEIINNDIKQIPKEVHDTVIIGENATRNNNSNTTRESKMMHNVNDQDDIVSWNEIFTLMRKTYKNDTGRIPEILKEDHISDELFTKSPQDEDIDGDGLIILEDIQQLKDFASKVDFRGNDKVVIKTYERIEEATEMSGILDKIPSQTKSVTVATACIAGLAVVLFLLTYAVFKWKQEKNSLQKRDVEGENIPTPVFENKKGLKNTNSIRSISPMLSTSNIYTRNTLDSRNGKESPEYMWDSLRKPFQ